MRRSIKPVIEHMKYNNWAHEKMVHLGSEIKLEFIQDDARDLSITKNWTGCKREAGIYGSPCLVTSWDHEMQVS